MHCCSTAASPTPKRTSIPRSPSRRSGRCSKRSGRAWYRLPDGSMAFTPSPPPSRRPASFASTTTSTRCPRAVGRPVEVQAYADRIVIRQDGGIVGEHARCFGRGRCLYDPWHYVPVLARKPGALRNGAPFKEWLLPANLECVRRKLSGSNDGDRQMVAILSVVLTDGLACVEPVPRRSPTVFTRPTSSSTSSLASGIPDRR